MLHLVALCIGGLLFRVHQQKRGWQSTASCKHRCRFDWSGIPLVICCGSRCFDFAVLRICFSLSYSLCFQSKSQSNQPRNTIKSVPWHPTVSFLFNVQCFMHMESIQTRQNPNQQQVKIHRYVVLIKKRIFENRGCTFPSRPKNKLRGSESPTINVRTEYEFSIRSPK